MSPWSIENCGVQIPITTSPVFTTRILKLVTPIIPNPGVQQTRAVETVLADFP
jgi:hypothetical protein